MTYIEEEWWRRRESNPIQLIDREGLTNDESQTEPRQKSNTFSTLDSAIQIPENPESDTSPTDSQQVPDTVEGRFCGHCVARSSEHRCDGVPVQDLNHAASEAMEGADLDGLELVVTLWPRLAKDVRDSVVRFVQRNLDSR